MRMGSLFNSWQRMALVIVLSLAAVGCGNKRSGNEPPPQYQPEVYDDGQQTWPSQAPQMVLVRRNGRMLEYATTTVVSERELREVIRSRSLRWRPANESITGEYPLNPTSGLYFVEKPNEISVDKAWSADPQNMSSMAVELDDDSSYRPHRPGHWRGHRGYRGNRGYRGSNYWRYNCQYRVGYWNYRHYCGAQGSNYLHYYPHYSSYNNWWYQPVYFWNAAYYYYQPQFSFQWRYYSYYAYVYWWNY